MNREQYGSIMRRNTARKRIGGRIGVQGEPCIAGKKNAAIAAAFFDKGEPVAPVLVISWSS